MPEVITVGETMVLFLPTGGSRLAYVHTFRKAVAGAESNVAIGLVRLGITAGWISRVGADEFGHAVLSAVRGEGVDVSRVRVDPEAPTGIMFRERLAPGTERVYYYRSGSAASRLQPDDLDPDYFAGARLLHLTGITPALSDSAAATVAAAMALARDRGLLVSFDLNIRPALWRNRDLAGTLLPLVRHADIVFGNQHEVQNLLGETADPAGALVTLGCPTAVVKLGVDGAMAARGGQRWHVPVHRPRAVIDGSGAGDSFASGFLAGYLRAEPIPRCLQYGNGMAQAAVSSEGDIECLPRSLEELLTEWC